MRDLERLKEVREYRVTGPQVASLLGLCALLMVAAFVAGFEVGLWQRPVDEQLLEPAGFVDRDPGEVLADLLAERSREEVESASGELPSLDSPPNPSDAEAEEAVGGVIALAESAMAEEDKEPLVIAAEAIEVVRREAVPEGADDPLVSDAGARENAPLVARDDTQTAAAAEPPGSGGTGLRSAPVASGQRTEGLPPLVAHEPLEVSRVSLPGPPSTDSGFTVQVGAYESEEEAAGVIERLRKQGFEAFHHQAKVGTKTWHRVRVGVFSSRALAEEEGRKLASVVPFSPFVTRQE